MGLNSKQAKERENALKNLKITTYEDEKGYVFISYKSENWEKVFMEKVIPLNRAGVRIYSDKNFDEVNDSWLETMETNIMESTAVILFISEEYVRSMATLIELLTAISEQKTIIPVYLKSKKELFNKSKNDSSFKEEAVVATPAEYSKLNALISLDDNKVYSKTLSNIKNRCKSRLDINQLKIKDIIMCFEKLLNNGNLQDSLFENNISALINRIQKAYSHDMPRATAQGWNPFEGSLDEVLKRADKLQEDITNKADDWIVPNEIIEFDDSFDTLDEISSFEDSFDTFDENDVFDFSQANTEIRSKINQVCMVVKVVKEFEMDEQAYPDILHIAYKEVAEKLNIGKFSVVDKCQRQLGLNAQQFAQMLFNQLYDNDDTLYNLIMSKTKNDSEKALVNETFNK